MVAQDATGKPLWRCSGTLLSPTVYLTAGHCTEAPAAHVEIWFQSDVEHGIPQNGYPTKGQVGGTPYTHPQFDTNAFYLHDVGVVVLDKPMAMPTYGALPVANQLDAQINTGFTGPQSLLLSNNANTGGTCFGDSGGPNFLGDSNVVAAVTSFGINPTCGGTGGVFRVDRPDVLAFVTGFLD